MTITPSEGGVIFDNRGVSLVLISQYSISRFMLIGSHCVLFMK